MAEKETYRLRAPASGREAIAPVSADGVYVDSVTGEEMEPVARPLPLAPSRRRSSFARRRTSGSAHAAIR